MKRLDFIVELTKGYDTVIDIGSDHGLVLKKAFDKGYIKKGLATDINIGPLNSAKKTLTGYPVEFYLSDGFKSVASHFDLAVITGMGPHLIADIMTNARLDATYLLGANEKLEVLRLWLNNHHYQIIDEYVIYDDFYYVFLKVTKGTMKLTEKEIYTGIHLHKKENAKDYYLHKIKHYEDLSNKTTGETKAMYLRIFTYFKDAFDNCF